MQQALDYIEKNKIFMEDLKTDMIPLTVAYKAIEMAIDNQIAEAMEALQSQLVGLVGDLEDLTPEEKKLLDLIHFNKIEMSDSILVVDLGGYRGESTLKEIDYANKLGKTVKYLSDFPDLQFIVDYSVMF